MLFLLSPICRLQYKYSRLIMTSGGRECELPTADSCAIMEGEDAEDDLMDLTKKSFFTKIKSFSREVSNPLIPVHIELLELTYLASCCRQYVSREHPTDSTRFPLSHHLHASD